MPTPLQDRIDSLIPYVKSGIPIYTGLGMLLPGTSPSTKKSNPRKPVHLPDWHVYQDGKGTGQPNTRYIQLMHQPRIPTGSVYQTYPTKNMKYLGHPMTIALGDGDTTPSKEELDIHETLLSTILHKLVWCVGIGRVHLDHETNSYSVSEPILAEVYDEKGNLLWANPFLGSLIDRLKELASGSLMGHSSRPPVISGLKKGTTTSSAVTPHSLSLDEFFTDLEAKNLDEEAMLTEVKAHFGIGFNSIAKRILHSWQEQRAKINPLYSFIREALNAGLDETDLPDLVYEEFGLSPSEVTHEHVLQAMSCAKPKSSTSTFEMPFSKPKSDDLTVSHESFFKSRNQHTEIPCPAPIVKSKPSKSNKRIVTPLTSSPQETLLFISENKEAIQKKALSLIASSPEGLGIIDIRVGCGIPKDHPKTRTIQDAFHRHVIMHLLNDGQIVKHGDIPRRVVYFKS